MPEPVVASKDLHSSLVLSRDVRARRLDDRWLIHFRADAPGNVALMLGDLAFADVVRFAPGAPPAKVFDGSAADWPELVSYLVDAGFLLPTEFAVDEKPATTSFEEILAIRKSVKTDWLGLLELEALVLYVLARVNPRPEPICELGSMLGGSTITLVLGARGSTHRNRVVSVDDHRWHTHLGGREANPEHVENLPTTLPQFEENLREAGVADEVEILVEDTARAASGFHGAVSLLFVDAGHTAAAIEADFAAWFPKLVPGGIVAFHDYGNSVWPDVQPTVDRLVGEFRSFGAYQSLAVGIKRQ